MRKLWMVAALVGMTMTTGPALSKPGDKRMFKGKVESIKVAKGISVQVGRSSHYLVDSTHCRGKSAPNWRDALALLKLAKEKGWKVSVQSQEGSRSYVRCVTMVILESGK